MTEEPTATQSELADFEDEEMNDMFDDYEDLDQLESEHLASMNNKMRDLSTNDQRLSAIQYDPVFLLRFFYERLFPYKMYCWWLSYGYSPTTSFINREFSFTLASDIYIRYNSFDSEESLKREIQRLQPHKIDIGAVYTVQPRMKKSVTEAVFKPVEKELVFDIDMTDYDEIRTCCSGGDVCNKCWTFMTIAIKVIDASLREDFGFKHLLWVYSGRRGVHCWVSDERARKLTNESRKAIVSFIEVVKGNSETVRKVKLPVNLHPSLERSLEILKPYFSDLLLDEQGVLDTPEQWNKILDIIQDQGLKGALNEEWSRNTTMTPEAKWIQLTQSLTGSFDTKTLARDILFQYCYPRLDDKVSVHINHLLKSPFCVHPKTQRVCVPIDPATCDKFDPLKVPTLQSLMSEYESHQSLKENNVHPSADYNKTSLGGYVEIFKKFVDGLIRENAQQRREEQDQTMEY